MIVVHQLAFWSMKNYQGQLGKKARQLKDKDYRYIWYKNCQVYARKKYGDPAIILISINQVEELFHKQYLIQLINNFIISLIENGFQWKEINYVVYVGYF